MPITGVTRPPGAGFCVRGLFDRAKDRARSCSDLADLAEMLGETGIAARSRLFAVRVTATMETLWSDDLDQSVCRDRASGTLVESPSVGGLLAAVAAIPTRRAAAIASRIEKLGDAAIFLVPSHDPLSQDFESLRYWRGPAWLIVNNMIADELMRAGQTGIVARIVKDSVRPIEVSGFADYHDPITAEPCGVGHFTWTAAMVIEFLSEQEVTA